MSGKTFCPSSLGGAFLSAAAVAERPCPQRENASYGTNVTNETNATSAAARTAEQSIGGRGILSHESHESHESRFFSYSQAVAEPVGSVESESAVLLKHGGYHNLLTYRKSLVIFLGTAAFVHRFLKPQDRTVDQMLQAARSGKQNIVEGSNASGVSKETELKLTGVARASLEELLEDCYDFLAVHGLAVWAKNGKEAAYITGLSRRTDDYEVYREFFETRSAEVCANILICLIHKCNYLLDRQLKRLEADFVKYGGLRERMTRARLDYRTRQSSPAPQTSAYQTTPSLAPQTSAYQTIPSPAPQTSAYQTTPSHESHESHESHSLSHIAPSKSKPEFTALSGAAGSDFAFESITNGIKKQQN